jgi:hypothetical protein
MKFISRAKRKALEEKLATLDASSDEAKEIRTKLGWGDPAPVVEASPPPPPPVEEKPAPPPPVKKAAPVVEASPPPPPPVEEKPVPKKTASKAKTTNKTGLFGKKTSTKK